MNFFAAQDKARKMTRRLVAVYAAATAVIVAGVTAVVGAAIFVFTNGGYGLSAGEFVDTHGAILAGIAVLTAIFIAGATVFRVASLSAGGSRVALSFGATPLAPDVEDPARRRLRNVVEEMSIASGVPVPDIFVLEREDGINAFAAGYAPPDAAIAVTRGALETLERDELQGVIAHEFSHILNGDMRLNIRLMGVLYGILALGLVGRTLLHGGRRVSLFSTRRSRGAPLVISIGLGLVILGGIGVFAARLIKAGVSRQREYLADASAVQFTRQTAGLAGALKKIGGYEAGSYLRAADPEEISHMLFGTGLRLAGLFATHPPLVERIRALDPSFGPQDFPAVRRVTAGTAPGPVNPAAASLAGQWPPMSPESIADTAGRPGELQVAAAAALRQSMPADLYAAAHAPDRASLLVVALLLDPRGRALERQFSIVMESVGEADSKLIYRYYRQFGTIAPELRLPFLEIAFPALRRRTPSELSGILDLARRVIEADNDIDLYEYCVYRVLSSSIRQSAKPLHRTGHRAGRNEIRRAAVGLLSIVARAGHDDDAECAAAFRAGIAVFGNWASAATFQRGQRFDAAETDRLLDALCALKPSGRELLIRAVGSVMMHDRQLRTAEAELLRAVCAALDVPMPLLGPGGAGYGRREAPAEIT